jgi:creatinine amidohydrolase
MAVHRWQALTTVEFSALPCSEMVAVLRLGATEQHGPHLPVGTDVLIGKTVLQRALERVWLSALWCIKSDEHRAFAGTLSLRAETLMAVLHDLCGPTPAKGPPASNRWSTKLPACCAR